jgi:hypothetical protein
MPRDVTLLRPELSRQQCLRSAVEVRRSSRCVERRSAHFSFRLPFKLFLTISEGMCTSEFVFTALHDRIMYVNTIHSLFRTLTIFVNSSIGLHH